MPVFQVLVEGHNFPGEVPCEKLGFFTTRFVMALSPEEAGEKAKDLVRAEYASLMSLAKSSLECPFLTVDTVEEIDTLPISSGQGATWFPADKI